MALRGRAARRWLVERLDVARRGADLLDRKRYALLREQTRLRAEAADARSAWRAAAARADVWGARSEIVDGPGRLELLARHVDAQASLELSWSNLMGARVPAAAQTVVPPPPPISALGGSSAAVLAARACREATAAAVKCALAERAEAAVAAEIGRAARRLRALEQRWIPQHEAALAELDLALDETGREDAARVRWLTRRRAGAG